MFFKLIHRILPSLAHSRLHLFLTMSFNSKSCCPHLPATQQLFFLCNTFSQSCTLIPSDTCTPFRIPDIFTFALYGIVKRKVEPSFSLDSAVISLHLVFRQSPYKSQAPSLFLNKVFSFTNAQNHFGNLLPRDPHPCVFAY